jgi:hypothetical protein
MIWIDKNAFTRDDIRFYVMIKKRKIWKILYWLSIYNSLYKNVHIDMKIMKKWKEKHIFYELKKNVIHIFQFDHYKRKDYVLNIKINNLKNELQALMSNLKKSFNIDFVLFNINENKQNSTIFVKVLPFDLFHQGTRLNSIREELTSNPHKKSFCTIEFLLFFFKSIFSVINTN